MGYNRGYVNTAKSDLNKSFSYRQNEPAGLNSGHRHNNSVSVVNPITHTDELLPSKTYDGIHNSPLRVGGGLSKCKTN